MALDRRDCIAVVCEGLRTEVDSLRTSIPDCPEIIYMAQGLHNEPDKMRQEMNAKIAEIEETYPDKTAIILGYGLCGRGMFGVKARRMKLVIPRVHDCVPLYVGVTQDELGMTEANSGILWLSAGMIEYSNFAHHLVEERYKKYREKFGEKRAAKMIQAENMVFANYKGLRYVRWPGLKEEFATLARSTAAELSLPYDEIEGRPGYIGDLLAGQWDGRRFLILEPGWTIDMDGDGAIVARKQETVQ